MITRMFDNEVKSFIKNILMNHNVAYHCYRIEFQARGMPHLHGVFWLPPEIVDNYSENGVFDKDKVTDLIDEWISCSIITGDDE